MANGRALFVSSGCVGCHNTAQGRKTKLDITVGYITDSTGRRLRVAGGWTTMDGDGAMRRAARGAAASLVARTIGGDDDGAR